MLGMLRRRLAKKDRQGGFTLIELMIVVLIVAILIGIAIPTFLGARTRSQDRAAQVDLRQSLLTAKAYYTDNQTYVATAAQLNALEPTISFNATISSASQSVVGFTGTATVFTATKQSKSGNWFCISDSTATGTTFGPSAGTPPVYTASAVQTTADTAAECAAPNW